MRGKLRVMTMSLLSLTGLCTAMLFACAGGNAVQTFSNRTAAKAAQSADRPLTGMVIAIDAGHGGYDGGAVGRVSGIPEKGLNLDVAQKLRMLLENQGARVIMTRTDDYALCDENPTIRKKLQDMQRRAAIITEGGAQMVLSIHMNEYAGRSQSGPQVFYREGCPSGRLLAGAVQEAMDDLNPEILDAVMDVTEAQEDGDEITEVYWDTQRELLHDFLLRLYDEVISTWK